MDPETTFTELLDALNSRDWDRVEERAQALLDWLQRRGFPPTTVGPKTLGQEWHHTLATCACYVALSKVKDARKRRRRRRQP